MPSQWMPMPALRASANIAGSSALPSRNVTSWSDVEKNMRPHPLPVAGDRVSAAGPVYRGSYGQSQIQATELHVARATRSRR